ncbi:MAG: hypothetical protein KA327_05120 [Pseudarcicella sp.]|nr:hypothetical protein [Pseudarcicella sp.]
MLNDISIIVLDDDPTGTQTVHDVPVFTTWSEDVFTSAFQEKTPLFYVLTNSRSLPEDEAVLLAITIGENIYKASTITDRSFLIISRGDSTLRGHFPAEVDAVATASKLENPLTVLAPAFIEGKRFTIDNIHYLEINGELVPVAETAFAKDPSFAYKNSNLVDWIEEKSKGKITKSEVEVLDNQLLKISDSTKVLIVNAQNYEDLQKASEKIKQLLKNNRSIILRSAASIVKTLGSISDKSILTKQDLIGNSISSNGGLVIIGSFVPITTQQLAYLQANMILPSIELKIADLLNPSADYIDNIVIRVESFIREGNTPVVFSERKLLTGNTNEESLAIGNKISATLVSIVQKLKLIPSFIIAKGGITSSDVATKGMAIEKATVLGQILPGIPVWNASKNNKYHGVPYVVFPGNVGSESALFEVVKLLTQ